MALALGIPSSRDPILRGDGNLFMGALPSLRPDSSGIEDHVSNNDMQSLEDGPSPATATLRVS